MRKSLNATVLSLAVTLAACGGGTQMTNQPAQNTSDRAATSAPRESATGHTSPLDVAPAHGGIKSETGATVGAAVAPGKPPVATPELDAKIDKELKKAKAPGATASDKKAAAVAYLERGNFYWSAGDVRLYRFALGDFRHVLRYDPTNTEAQAKIDELVRIYKQLGKPVPDIGNEL